jgi:hypothetical protein
MWIGLSSLSPLVLPMSNEPAGIRTILSGILLPFGEFSPAIMDAPKNRIKVTIYTIIKSPEFILNLIYG